MKAHKIMMAVVVALAIILLIFGPNWGVGREFGLLLLVCPLMMLGMMVMMGNNHKH